MSTNATREITWSHGTDTFCLAISQQLQLEDKCNAGLGAIKGRLETGTWWVNDIRETLRLGLIGGGMKPEKAQKVVELHAEPYAESVLVAYEILIATIILPPGEQPGKKPAADREPESGSTATMADSPGSPATTLPPGSDGSRESLTA